MAASPEPRQHPGSPSGAARIDADQVRPILPQLIDSLSDAMVVVDTQRRVVAANRRYLEAFGGQGVELVGHHCLEVLACPAHGQGPADADCPACDTTHACVACEAMVHKQPQRQMRMVPDAHGVMHRWEATFSPVLDESGEVTHVVEVWRDVSERSQLEAQLAHSERLAALGMLAAGVAHEINNPMASILAGVERLGRWLARAPVPPAARADDARKLLDGLEAEVQRTREITEKLLLLAQPYHAAPAWVDVNRAARDTMSLLAYQMSRQKVRGTVDLDPGLPAVLARESGVRGILMNLSINAIQAMPEGGTLTIRTRREGDRVRIEIEDTGPGIAPAILDRIWDPFFTTKPPGQGTGLGLSITRQTVLRYHGTILVDSPPGRGARFVVELPIEAPGGPLG